VHCFAGVSRSATIVIAYLMQELGKGMLEAMKFVKRRRPVVSPNFGFQRQLMDFESALWDKNPDHFHSPLNSNSSF
jgi:protein-tyrosine phosphatase